LEISFHSASRISHKELKGLGGNFQFQMPIPKRITINSVLFQGKGICVLSTFMYFTVPVDYECTQKNQSKLESH